MKLRTFRCGFRPPSPVQVRTRLTPCLQPCRHCTGPSVGRTSPDAPRRIGGAFSNVESRMILPPYRIAASSIPGAGKGLFREQPVERGRLIISPDDIRKVYKWKEVQTMPGARALLASTVRWFEDHYTVTPEWPDECYVNHSFAPCGLWHLGFVFALDDLPAGSEITVDYRHLLAPDQEEDFCDAATGRRIVGYSWH